MRLQIFKVVQIREGAKAATDLQWFLSGLKGDNVDDSYARHNDGLQVCKFHSFLTYCLAVQQQEL